MIPRALHKAGVLQALITDVWVSPTVVGHQLYPQRLRERFHPELSDAPVKAFYVAALSFEAPHSMKRTDGWDLILRRNEWFQTRALRQLSKIARSAPGRQFSVFSFSYTARRIFEFARSRGWTTVLGQIDPGPPEEHMIAKAHEDYPYLSGRWERAPLQYWRDWRDECSLADQIIVNSTWSRQALITEGVPAAKISTVPLAYEAPAETAGFTRCYPTRFTPERPMRVLFLGQISLRKGMAQVIGALQQLRDDPVEFCFAGPIQMNIPAEHKNSAQVRWVGTVRRGAVADYYRQADVFLFPTLSDGFGLTQLEAQVWNLPIIASRFCGEVVRHDINGLLLASVSAESIAGAIRLLLADPSRLQSMSTSATTAEYSVDRLRAKLLQLGAA